MGTSGTVRLDIVARGRDAVTRVLGQGNKALGRYSAQVQHNSSTLRRQAKAAQEARRRIAAITAATAAAAVASFKMGEAGAQFEAQLARLGGGIKGATARLRELQEASGGVFSLRALADFETRQRELGVSLNFTGVELEKLDARFTALGMNGSEALKQLVEALASGRTTALKRMGLLLEGQKATVQTVRDNLRTVSTEGGTTIAAWERVAAQISDAWTALKLALAPLGKIIEPITRLLKGMANIVASILRPALDGLAFIVETVSGLFGDGALAADEQASALDNVASAARGARSELTDLSKVSETVMGAQIRAAKASVEHLEAEIKLRPWLRVVYRDDLEMQRELLVGLQTQQKLEKSRAKLTKDTATVLKHGSRETGEASRQVAVLTAANRAEARAIRASERLRIEAIRNRTEETKEIRRATQSLRVQARRRGGMFESEGFGGAQEHARRTDRMRATLDAVKEMRAERKKQAKEAGARRAEPFLEMADSALKAQQAMSMLRPELSAIMGAVGEAGGVWGEYARTQDNVNLALSSSVGIGAMLTASFIGNERKKAAIMAPLAAAQGFLALPNLALAGPKFAAAALFGGVALTGMGTRGGGGTSPGAVGEPGGPLGPPLRTTGGGRSSGGGTVNVVFGDGIMLGRPQDVGRAVQQALGSTRGTGIRARGV